MAGLAGVAYPQYDMGTGTGEFACRDQAEATAYPVITTVRPVRSGRSFAVQLVMLVMGLGSVVRGSRLAARGSRLWVRGDR